MDPHLGLPLSWVSLPRNASKHNTALPVSLSDTNREDTLSVRQVFGRRATILKEPDLRMQPWSFTLVADLADKMLTLLPALICNDDTLGQFFEEEEVSVWKL